MSSRSDPEVTVAIVGGGPSASSTALHLLARAPALRGRVHVFEKKQHPREKYCGGAVSAWGLQALERLGLRDRVRGRAIDAFALRMGDRVQRLARADLGVVVRRSVLDEMLFREAEARGAVAHERCAVTDAKREDGAWTLRTSDGELRAKWLVGADGASGVMRRVLDLGEPRRKAHLYLCESPGVMERRDGVSDGTLLFDLTPVTRGVQGYYWDFPAPLDGVEGTSRGIFHLNDDERMADGALKQAFGQSLDVRGVAIGDVKLKAYAIRPYVPGARISVPGGLLTGEAIGIDPVTGEGIAHAIEFGRLASDELLRAMATGDERFDGWAERVRRSFVGKHLRQACFLAPHLYGPRSTLVCSALASSPRVVDLGLRWYVGQEPRARDALMLAGLLAREGVMRAV